jgi:hypothetical protein
MYYNIQVILKITLPLGFFFILKPFFILNLGYSQSEQTFIETRFQMGLKC